MRTKYIGYLPNNNRDLQRSLRIKAVCSVLDDNLSASLRRHVFRKIRWYA